MKLELFKDDYLNSIKRRKDMLRFKKLAKLYKNYKPTYLRNSSHYSYELLDQPIHIGWTRSWKISDLNLSNPDILLLNKALDLVNVKIHSRSKNHLIKGYKRKKKKYEFNFELKALNFSYKIPDNLKRFFKPDIITNRYSNKPEKVWVFRYKNWLTPHITKWYAFYKIIPNATEISKSAFYKNQLHGAKYATIKASQAMDISIRGKDPWKTDQRAKAHLHKDIIQEVYEYINR
jgi:hypothetical protein